MPIVRSTTWLLPVGTCVALALTAAGCASRHLSSDEPSGVQLDGSWKVDRAASDDLQKVIDQLSDQVLRRFPRQSPISPRRRGGPDSDGTTGGPGGAAGGGGPGGPAGAGGGGGPYGGSGGQGAGNTADTGGYDSSGDMGGAGADGRGPPGPRGPNRSDLLRWSPTMHVLSSYLARGDFITIKQSPEQMVFDYGGSIRRYTPGAHSVVSAEGGVADQITGWKGNEYVINIRAQQGPSVVERYGLSDDHKHLVEKVHITGGDLGTVNFTRVYEHTNDIVPRALPSND